MNRRIKATEQIIIRALDTITTTIENTPDKDRSDDMHTIHMHCMDALGVIMDRRNMEHIDDLLSWANSNQKNS